MVFKRILAYVFDLLFVFLISSLIVGFIPKTKELDTLYERSTEITQKYTDKEITSDEYIEMTTDVNYDIKSTGLYSSIIFCAVLILYYIILQFYLGGQTLGKKLMRIKVVKLDGKLSINDIAFRSMIVDFIVVYILDMIFLLCFKKVLYIKISDIMFMVYEFLLFVCLLMIISKPDKRGIHEILTKTKVVMKEEA